MLVLRSDPAPELPTAEASAAAVAVCCSVVALAGSMALLLDLFFQNVSNDKLKLLLCLSGWILQLHCTMYCTDSPPFNSLHKTLEWDKYISERRKSKAMNFLRLASDCDAKTPHLKPGECRGPEGNAKTSHRCKTVRFRQLMPVGSSLSSISRRLLIKLIHKHWLHCRG
jgi:hypothetical protein